MKDNHWWARQNVSDISYCEGENRVCHNTLMICYFTWLMFKHIYLRWPSVPNFLGQSRILRACPEKNTRTFGTLNCPEFHTLSQICSDLMSRCVAVQAVDQNAVDYFDIFACQRCVLLGSKCTKSVFGGTPLEKLRMLPHRPHSRMAKGQGSGYPLPIPFPLAAFGVLISASSLPRKCPEFLS